MRDRADRSGPMSDRGGPSGDGSGPSSDRSGPLSDRSGPSSSDRSGPLIAAVVVTEQTVTEFAPTSDVVSTLLACALPLAFPQRGEFLI